MTNFVLVQKNSWALNIKKNFDLACEIIEKYKNHDNAIIIFPENFLIGYPFGDVLEKFPKIVDDNIKFLELFDSVIKRTINEIMRHKTLDLKYEVTANQTLEYASEIKINLISVVAEAAKMAMPVAT